jgi:hypothetical protein
LVVAPAAAERKPRVARAQIPASRQLAQRSWWLAGRPVDRLPDAGEQAIAAQHRHGGREDRPAPANEAVVIAPQRRKAAEGLEAPFAGDDEEDAARLAVVVAELALGDPVAGELLGEALAGLGRAIPLKEVLDHGAHRRLHEQSGVGADTLLEPLGRPPRPGPPSHRQCLVSERRGDEVSDEAVYLQPVRELPVRAPVVAPLPAELLALHAEQGGDQVGAGLVEQPMRLRFAGAEARGRVEAIEHPLAVEEEQPVLRPPSGGEEEERQLIGRQQLLLVEAERDLPIASVTCRASSARRSALTRGARPDSRKLRIGPCLSGLPVCRITRPHARFRASPETGRRCSKRRR